jgi:hypothetical protein
MDTPAQTFNFMIAGYIVIFGALIGYVISLIVRTKNTRELLKMIKRDK